MKANRKRSGKENGNNYDLLAKKDAKNSARDSGLKRR